MSDKKVFCEYCSAKNDYYLDECRKCGAPLPPWIVTTHPVTQSSYHNYSSASPAHYSTVYVRPLIFDIISDDAFKSILDLEPEDYYGKPLSVITKEYITEIELIETGRHPSIKRGATDAIIELKRRYSNLGVRRANA